MLVATVAGCSANVAGTTPQFQLSLVSSGGGSIVSTPPGIDCRSDCLLSSVIFPAGTEVTLTAVPETGRLFSGWSGDCTGLGNCVVQLDADKNVTATFTTTSFPLVVTLAGTGGGTVTSAPTGIDCPGTCTSLFPYGIVVTLTATPDRFSEFAGWSGSCEGTGPTCSLTMDRAKGATATFVKKRFDVTVEKTGTGDGSVVSQPSGIDCGATCTANYPAGTMVVLTATPSDTSTFEGWAGTCTGTGTCALALDQSYRVSANFRKITFEVSVLRTLGGSVASQPLGIDCGATCSGIFDIGALVALVATPEPTAHFAGWSGDCIGLVDCLLTIDGPKTVAARFTYPLTVRRVGTGTGLVRSAPSGIDCGTSCATEFDPGTLVTLTATPETHSNFISWAGACDGTETCRVSMTEARTVTATFTKKIFPVVVNRAGTGSGTVRSVPMGIDCGTECAASYESGTQITLTATSDNTSNFTGWSGSCSGVGPCVLDVDRVRFVTATFSRITYTLTIARNGSGTVTSEPLGIFCGSVCTAPFDIGATVTLSATADAGASFGGWGGACTGTGRCTLNMDQAKVVNATFTRTNYALTVNRVGTGGGSVSSVPPGISCGAECTASYQIGTLVTLTAAPDASSTFAGWSGACTGNGLCVITLDSATTVNATFSRQNHVVTVSLQGSGGGIVSSTPPGIDCGSSCAAAFSSGTRLTLSAVPDPSSTFVGWTGACTGTGACIINVSAPAFANATFSRVKYALTANVATGGGTVLSDPFGIFCGPLCSASYDSGMIVSLTAMPEATATFAGWTGACAGTGPCVVTMDGAKTVTARFTFRLTVNKNSTGGGQGTITSSLPGINCGATCAAEFDPDAVITLTASANSTSLFAGWSGACSGTAACVLTMDTAKGVNATFTSNLLQLTVNRTGSGAGTVTSAPSGISCGSSCQATYLNGTQVTLSAAPANNSVFAGWSGACSGTGNCLATIDASKSVTATFSRVVYNLAVNTGRGGGTVTSSPAGVYCGAVCSADYDANAVVTLTAQPDVTAVFAGWSGACVGTGDCVVTMDAAKNVTARFTFRLQTSRAGTGTGAITSTPSGINCGSTCVADYDRATIVTLTASPDVGSSFTGWSGSCSGSAGCSLAMDAAKTATATFTRGIFQLAVSSTGNGGGTIVSNPAGINCGTNCTASYDASQQVTLTATPDGNSVFAGWSGACAGAGTCAVSMDTNRSVVSTFTKRRFTLSVNRTGAGTVTSDTGGVFCGAACTGTYDSGSVVTLTASPDATSSFTGWSGACTGIGPCAVTVDGAKLVGATFTTITYGLTVTKAGAGAGSVTSTPAGIDCGTSCSFTYDSGSVVTLTATPTAISTFAGWSGSCSGTGACTVTLSAARSVTATFDKSRFPLTITRTGTGGGVVQSNPAGIDCGTTCSASYDGGVLVSLIGTADTNSTFAGWTGACTGTATCSLTMDAAKSLTATFMKRTYTVSLTRTGAGTVTSDPTGLYCGAQCSSTFDSGALVVLTASPDLTASFIGWSGACTGTGTCPLTMNGNKSVTATFTTNAFLLAVNRAGAGAGTVTSTPAGVDCGNTCSASYDSGTVVTLTATPSSTSVFAGWTGACTGAGVCTVTLGSARTVTATFEKNRFALAVSRTGTGVGTVTSSPAGIACGATCSFDYEGGQTVALTATADGTSTFVGWSGACAGSSTCSVSMDAAKSVTATFARDTFVLTLNRVGDGGTVTSDPAGVYCGAACASSFASGAVVTLTATPDGTATFTGWAGACTGAGACQVTMNAAKSVTATFTTNTYDLTVAKAGAGVGSVLSTPAGVDCGTTCTGNFLAGTVVTLTAAPNNTSTFQGWSGACTGTGACTVTLSVARGVTATFARSRVALTVSKTGSGGGTLQSAPTGIDCGTTCSSLYDGGTAVTLAATADTNSTFVGWAGACSGATSCVVTLDAAKTVTATFARSSFTLGLTRVGSGTVTSTPAGIYCGAACSASFDSGSSVTLSATADASSSFVGWTGACAGSTTCVVTMDSAKSVTATFSTNVFALSVSRAGNGAGGVTSTPSGVDCGSTCSASYDSGTVVTLSATPNATSAFAGWTGACTGAGPCTLTMTAAKSVTATFTLGNFILTVNRTGTGTGNVTSSPAGVNCGVACGASFQAGTVVNLSAVASGTSTFAGWTGACTGTGACQVTMDQSRTVGAAFTAFTYDLSVDIGAGGGVVSSDVTGIYCGADCSQSYQAGDLVTLSAAPDPGASFLGWSGDCTGTSTCVVSMSQSRTVRARFAFALNVARAGTGNGQLTSSPAAIDCGTTCSANFDNATVVTLVATPDALSIFVGWTGACSGNLTCTLTMDGARSATATFTRATYTLTVSRTGSGTGTLTSTPSGISCGGTCSAVYPASTVVALAPVADPSSTFTGWSGACTGVGACSVTVDAAKSVSATFSKNIFALNVVRAGNGNGIVTSAPLAIYCGATCAASFDSGTAVTLTASADSRSTFTGWTGACVGLGDCALSLTQARSVTATFVTNTFVLSVNRAGSGGGLVTSSPGALSCGGTCTDTFDSGTQVTLSATPNSTSLFAGWSGACTSTGSCVVTMDQARSVTATFTKATYTLTVAKNGSGSGTLSSAPTPGVACGATCSIVYDASTAVTVTATPDGNSSFAGWSGACTGVGACTLTMDAAKTVSGTFTKNVFTVTVNRTGNGTVTSAPLALFCGATCVASFDSGASVVLTATADRSSSFTGWTGACTGTGTCTLSVIANTSVSATFVTNNFTVTVARAGTGGGSVSSSPTGIDCGATCSASYESGALVTLTATPNAASIFTGWSGACSGTGQCLLAMDAAKSLTANFAPNTFALTVVKTGNGGGLLSSSPAGVDCGVTCSASYPAGTQVTLTPAPDANSSFGGWSGACIGTAPCTVTMDAAKNLSGTFTRNTYALTVTRAGNGTVTSAPLAIFCGATCAASFDSGTSVTLTALPERGATFTGWSGACTGTGTCVVPMNGARAVSATFVTNTFALIVAKSGAGTGSVSSSPAGVTCGLTCNATYDSGTVVTLSATPDSASIFSGWSGACSGTGQCLLSMDADKSVTAVFIPNTFLLTVSKNGNGLGTVTSTPSGINCGTGCSATYNAGTIVNLAVTPDVTSTFDGWSGACNGTGACAVTVDAAKSVSATFTRKPYTVTLTRTGGGTITSDPLGIYCGATCAGTFNAGTSVTLSVTADAGATFVGWGGACSGNAATCTLGIDAAKTVSARFSFPVSVSLAGTGAGAVTSTPTGISCGTFCGASFDGASLVTLTAAGDATSSFSGWSGSCSGTGTCVMAMDGVKSVTATFSRTTNSLTVSRTGTGGGTVTSLPTGINCGTACSVSYTLDTAVVLTAAADTTSTFAGWSGACSGASATCSVAMDAAKSVTATFTRVTYSLTVTRTVGGSVSSSPLGIFCGAACSGVFDAGTDVTLSPSPDSGATFAGWSGACTGNGSCVVTMSAARSVSARFTYPLTVAKNGTGTGIVSSADALLSCGTGCVIAYDGGTVVTLNAAPSGNATFAGWTGPCSGTGACVVTMDASKFVTATFNGNTVSLAVTRNGTGDGRVTSVPAGLDCGAACIGQFDVDSQVTLAATPEANSSFAGWSGACTGTSACVLTLNASLSATATFTRVTFGVTVSRTGSGLITSSPPSIYCGSACASTFDAGSTVTLTATADPGATFVGWGGGACSGVGGCTLTMSSAKTVTATFTNPLTVSRTGTGNGTIVSTPGGINCGPGNTACTATFSPGTAVSLSASPQSDSSFAGWSGACSGLGSCAVTMDAAKSVTAIFLKQQFYVFVGRDGNGVGTVISTPGGVNCGSNCAGRFDGGTAITLTATPDGYSTFSGWSGACSGTSNCTISSLDSDKSITATFTRPKFTLTTTRAGPGTLISSPAGILCQPQCSVVQDSGSLITVSPVPDTGASFGDWSGACSGPAATCPVTMDGNKTVNARFGYLLTVDRTGGGGGTVSATVVPTTAPNGLNCGATCSYVYTPGTLVTLTAAADPGGAFIGWSGAGCLGTSPCTVTMSQAQTVSASFTMPVTVSRYKNGGGKIVSVPDGINCGGGGACTFNFVYGTSVVLTAMPDNGAVFNDWTGCDSTNGSTCTLAVNGVETVQGRFMYPITVARNTAVMGTVTATGMTCGSTCSVNYNYGDVIAFTAAADTVSGYGFGLWGGCDAVSGTQNQVCSAAATSARTITPTFSDRVTVSLVGGAAGGYVTSSPAGINCGSTCSYNFNSGTSISLTPTATGGASFRGWTSGCDSVVGTTCNLNMNGNKNVVAAFAFPLTVTLTGGGGGTVTGTSISCPGTCSALYDNATALTLSATPDAAQNAAFVAWTGCDTVDAQNRCVLSMTAPKAVNALFRVPLTVSTASGTSPIGGGVFTGSSFILPGSVTALPCPDSLRGASCAGYHDYGSTVTVLAVADRYSVFKNWGTTCPTPSGSSCQVPMTQARAVTATFDVIKYAVTVNSATPNSGTPPSAQAGGGTISSTSDPATGASPNYNPTQITNCAAGTTCALDFTRSSNVFLTATVDATSTFTGWTNCPSANGNVCTITNLQAAQPTITANFKREYRTLSLNITGTGVGTVTSAPVGISCTGPTTTACTGDFVVSSLVALTPVAGTDSVFAGWSGTCESVVGSVCNVSMAAAATIGAIFSVACTDTVATASCSSAINIGSMATGASYAASGNLPIGSTSDWYQVSFAPASGAVVRGGDPRITLTSNPGGIFRLEVTGATCGSAVRECVGNLYSGGCTAPSGSATGLTAWDVSDTFAGGAGTSPQTWENQCYSNWPSTVFFRVYRTNGTLPSCSTYVVTVAR